MFSLMPNSWKQVLGYGDRGKSMGCNSHQSQNKILQTCLSKYPPPYNLSQTTKILFAGLIFPQTSLETTKRPFYFSLILIFAYWLLLKGPQATKGIWTIKFCLCIPILLETEQKKLIWKASKEKENKKVVKLLFIGSICECIDLISFGRVSDNRTSHIFESWAQARSQAGFGIWLPMQNRKSIWSRANTAQGTLCWGSDQLLWFMVSAAYTSLFWASKNTTVSQKTKKICNPITTF